MSDTKSPPLDVIGGLKEAIGSPIAKDFESAYWMQRAARAKYPAADSILNFMPYLGVATNVDDIQRNARDNGSFDPRDLAGLAVGVAATKFGLKGVNTLATGAGRARTASNVRAVGIGMPAAAYAGHYVDAQRAANEQYGDRPLIDIAKELSR